MEPNGLITQYEVRHCSALQFCWTIFCEQIECLFEYFFSSSSFFFFSQYKSIFIKALMPHPFPIHFHHHGHPIWCF